jgi:hypothetical protein
VSDFFGGRSSGGPSNLSFAQHNPLFGRGAGRNIIELSFDDSIDATHSLECYFVMPDRTRAVTAANVWIQTKPFRQYVAGAASGTTSSDTSHTHGIGTALLGSDVSGTGSGGGTVTGTDAQGVHTHLDGDTITTTGTSVSHSHNVSSHTHTGPSHSHTYFAALSTSDAGSSHSHTLTPSLTSGIFETAASGTIALFVADDGVTYDATHPIATGVAVATGITKQDILATPSGGSVTSHLTKATGNKRIKITGTALMRVQVLIVLDLKVSVF